MSLTRLAPAKINLMLHVVGRLKDGFHHLQSLISFAPGGDQITLEKVENSHLTVDGPFAAHVPLNSDNSVVLAARWIKEQFPTIGQAHIHLTKNLPVASGMGGGSSDGAALIVSLLELYEISLTLAQQDDLILSAGVLGADVPVCLAHQFGRGPLLWIDSSGREILPVPIQQALPGVMVLINPGVAMSTPAIFKKIEGPYTPPHEFQAVLDGQFHGDLMAYLAAQKNDLMIPAMAQESKIGEVMNMLQELPGCLLARMSGSGATCFALFGDEPSAQAACSMFEKAIPKGWNLFIPNKIPDGL